MKTALRMFHAEVSTNMIFSQLQQIAAKIMALQTRSEINVFYRQDGFLFIIAISHNFGMHP